MKKRVLCLLLCLVTVLSVVLTSCSEKSNEQAITNITEEASQSAVTLSMWVVSENEVSEETASKINEALNSITNSKFKIRLVVNFLTEELNGLAEEAVKHRKNNVKNCGKKSGNKVIYILDSIVNLID